MVIQGCLDTFRSEVETALRIFYAYEGIKKLLADQMYVDLINKNISFWRIYISSVQTKLFIALGRLYDDSRDSFSFKTFSRTCRDNFQEFDKAGLEARKRDGAAIKPDWLDDYLDKAYYPTIEDINTLFRLTRPHNDKFKGLYRSIRDKVFAHAVHTDSEAIANMFQGTDFEEIEAALTVLWSIYSQIWQLYNNGRQPSFSIESYPYKDEVVDGLKTVLLTTA
ncbi:MAG: hypothetical protein GJT30_07820 [Geobacter sp.]|nr:hypothetical protein [Geobacter sp.]